MIEKNIIWISWERHRRTLEIANALGVSLININSRLPTGFSHIINSILTIKEILIRKPKVLIVQNPSIILAVVASVIKFILKYKLIVDRHTNFRIGKSVGLNPAIILYTLFSNFSLRHADLTIITNSFLKKVVENKGGQGFVLKDKLPHFFEVGKKKLKGEYNVVFICTYADDEPYLNVINAAGYLPESIFIYITGKVPKKIDINKVPSNVILTGYLPEKSYVELLNSAHVIMDLTDLDWCLVCGGYEAISLGKPLITSKTFALKELFGDSAVYTTHNPEDIANNIKLTLENYNFLSAKVLDFKKVFQFQWNADFEKLRDLL